MSLSVTITHPMPGAVLPPTFTVCGTSMQEEIVKEKLEKILKSADRNAILTVNATILVYVTKDGVTYGPFEATYCKDSGDWEATVSGIPGGSGYAVSATIEQGSNRSSHAIEWVTVDPDAVVRVPVQCCQGKGDEGTNPIIILPLGARKKKVTVQGTFSPAGGGADDVFGVVWSLNKSMTVENLPSGGKHYKVSYRRGNALPGKYGELAASGRMWRVADIEVDAETYVGIYLKRGGVVIGSNSSPLF